jgi:hypothetical protein
MYETNISKMQNFTMQTKLKFSTSMLCLIKGQYSETQVIVKWFQKQLYDN